MEIISVPVEFWGYEYPHGKFEIKYNSTNQGWNYTPTSAYQGDKPYTNWINEKFKYIQKPNKQGVEYVQLVRDLVIENGVPKRMKFGLQECLTIPEELKKKRNEWKYWSNEPEPDTSAYYRDIDLDTENWQQEDAEIKCRGYEFEPKTEVLAVIVEFWGHEYPGEYAEIEYNYKTKKWRYSTLDNEGDVPYVEWIMQEFKYIQQPNDKKVEHRYLTRRLICTQKGEPAIMRWELNEWYAPLEDGYYPYPLHNVIDLDVPGWQSKNAKIKHRGKDFD